MASERKSGLGWDGLICSCLLIAMTTITVIQVFNRYVLGLPLSWPEEISAWIFIWLSFFGLAFGRRRGSFISIDIFTSALFPRRNREIAVFSNFCTFICYVLFCYGAYLYLASAIVSGQLSPVTRLPSALPKLALFVGAFMVAVAALRGMYFSIRKLARAE